LKLQSFQKTQIFEIYHIFIRKMCLFDVSSANPQEPQINNPPQPRAQPKSFLFELLWLAIVFPVLLFFTIVVLTSRTTGHRFKQSTQFVWHGLMHEEVWPWIFVGAAVGLISPLINALIVRQSTQKVDWTMQFALVPFMTMASGLVAFECHLRNLSHWETMLLTGASNALALWFVPALTLWPRVRHWYRERALPKLD
jgi:hypothetical protein